MVLSVRSEIQQLGTQFGLGTLMSTEVKMDGQGFKALARK